MIINTEQKPVQTSVVILTWNSARYLPNCLDTLLACLQGEALAHEVIVVDNGSTDATRHILEAYQKQYPDVLQIIALDKNHGTTRSRNLALRKTRGRTIIILDADTEIISGSFKEALNLVTTDPQIGILAPQLMLGDGQIQHSVKKIPSMGHKLLKMINILFGTNFPNHDFYGTFPFKESTAVESAISACWILSDKTVKQTGLLDERIFYSPEDLDYSVRVRLNKKIILYYPHLKLLHHTQQVTHRAPFSRQAISHLKGLIYFYIKHIGSLRRLRC